MVKVFSIIFSVLFIAACVQVPVEPEINENQLAVSSVWDVDSRYPAGNTFRLSPVFIEQSSIPVEEQRKVYNDLSKVIATELMQKGYVLTTGDSDFVIEYAVALSSDISDKQLGDKFGVTPGLSSDDEHQKGNFLVGARDGKTHMRVWRGAVQGFVQTDLSNAQRDQRWESIVNMVLSQFYKAI